jgi:hypothetical protein
MCGCPGKVRVHRTWKWRCYLLFNATTTNHRRIIAASSPHHRLERHSVDCGRANYVGPMTNFHDLEMTSITGEQVSFGELKGNLALVVNVASA